LIHPSPEFWEEMFEELGVKDAKKELLKIIYEEINGALRESSLDKIDLLLLNSLKAAIELAMSDDEEVDTVNATKLIGLIRSIENGRLRELKVNKRFSKWKS